MPGVKKRNGKKPVTTEPAKTIAATPKIVAATPKTVAATPKTVTFTPKIDKIPAEKKSCNPQQARFVVISSREIDGEGYKPLSTFSPFQVSHALDKITTAIIDTIALPSGDLLVKVVNRPAADKLMKLRKIDVIPVVVTSYAALNVSLGRIFTRNIIDITEQELLKELASQKVIGIRKIVGKKTNQPTGAAIVTFDGVTRPNFLTIGWQKVDVEEFVRSPMRCMNCQQIGHIKKWCKCPKLCRECCFPVPHETCTRKYCINCESDDHTSYDIKCPTFAEHRSINKIVADIRCTPKEAWDLYHSDPEVYAYKPPIRSHMKLITQV